MHIVITGSSRGLGLAMAREFLKKGALVTLSGTSEESVSRALGPLREEFGESAIGFPCDITQRESVIDFWELARSRGKVDIWVNNAGVSIEGKGYWAQLYSEIIRCFRTDIEAVMEVSHIVGSRMLADGGGRIYTMEGYGSNGMMRPGMTAYGTAKRALRYFTMSLAKEAEGTGLKIGRLSPGMVATDLLLKDGGDSVNPSFIKVVNILADRPERVARFLVKGMMKDGKNNSYIPWLTTPKIIFRFLTAFARKGRLLDEEGNLKV